MVNDRFTWSNLSEKVPRPKRDTFLLSERQLDTFKEVRHSLGRRVMFDHWYACLILDSIMWGPSPLDLT